MSGIEDLNNEDNKPKLILAGVDDGYASTKVYLGNGKQFKILSSVRSGMHGLTSIHGAPSSDNSIGGYETEGVNYTVGDAVDGEGTRFDEYSGSALNRVVVHHALRLAGLGGQSVRIATGLPVSDFYKGNDVNEPKIKHKRKSFAVHVNSLDNKALANITSSVVCSEAVSAYIDHIMNEEGKVKNGINLTNPYGIVDIGGRTTDCVWISPPDKIDHSKSGTANLGVLNLLDALESVLSAKYDMPSISRRVLEIAATDKKIRVYGKDQDCSKEVNGQIEEISDKIYREILRRIGHGAELDAIIFSGGGAALMPNLAAKFKNSTTPKNPEFSNARGMYKFLKTFKQAV